MKQLSLISILLILLSNGATLFAQDSPTLTGTVTDPNGAVVAQASVVAKNLRDSVAYRTTSDSQGRYEFSKLAAGRYLIAISADTFRTATREIDVKGETEATLDFQLEVAGIAESVVTRAESYLVPVVTTAAKVDSQILETPIAVQSVNRAVLDDQQVVRIDRALENVSGVYQENGQGVENFFNLRGFRADDIYRNGVKARAGRNIQGPRETVNLESIEVLKGPASILYGRLQPGGLINVVPKQPLAEHRYMFQQQFGANAFFRTTFDATGSLTKTDKLLYRVNLSWEKADSFREFTENDRFFISPVLLWNLTARTQLKFDLEYLNSTDLLDYGNPALGTRPIDLPRQRNLGEPGSNLDTKETRFAAQFSHLFNENWTIRSRFDTDYLDLFIPPQASLAGLDASTCQSASCLMLRNLVGSNGDGRSFFTTNDLTGRFSTGSIKHTVLAGGDYWRDRNYNRFQFNFFFPSIDVFNPVHTPVDPAALNTPDFDATTRIIENWYGLYVQDQLTLPKNFHLLAGFRYDNAGLDREDISVFGTDSFTEKQKLDQNGFSSRVGLLWRPISQVSLYGNYVESFGTSNGRNADGKLLPPQTAQQWEFGVKTELLNRRLVGTVAWFDITKQNLTVPDPDPLRAGAGFRVAVGEARNRGLELDVTGDVLAGWKVIAAYAFIDSEITRDSRFSDGVYTPGNTGNRFYGVPRHGGSLWTTYQIQNGQWKGTKFGGGIVARGVREGDNANSFQLPAYAVVNLTTGYDWKLTESHVLTLQLNVENLFDKEYFTTAGIREAGIGFGLPRTLIGSIRLQW